MIFPLAVAFVHRDRTHRENAMRVLSSLFWLIGRRRRQYNFGAKMGVRIPYLFSSRAMIAGSATTDHAQFRTCHVPSEARQAVAMPVSVRPSITTRRSYS